MYVGKCVILGDLCYSLVGNWTSALINELSWKIATTVEIVRGTLLSLNFTFVSVLMNLSVIISRTSIHGTPSSLEKCPLLEVSHQVTSINSVDCTFLVINLWDHDFAKKKLFFMLFKAVKKKYWSFVVCPTKSYLPMLTWFHFKSDFIVTVAREPLCNDEKLKINISKCQPWTVALHYVSRANHFVLGFIFLGIITLFLSLKHRL